MSGIRFPAPAYSRFASELLGADGLESCGIAFAHRDDQADSWVVAEAEPVSEAAYASRGRYAATLTTHFLLEVANRSRATGMAAIIIHTHPFANGTPEFSRIDDRGEDSFAPYLARRGAAVPHLAMVIGPDGCRARRLDDGRSVQVWEVGERLVLHSPMGAGTAELRDDRQIRAFGEPGQRMLKQLHFGLVGAGGTGSVTGQQLAHLGATKVSVIDPDLVESTNLNRLVGAVPDDIGSSKVDVAKRMMQAINPGMEVHEIRGDVVDEEVAAKLSSFDFIFLCTDSHASRAVVNQAAYQHLIPGIDMGVRITVAQDIITHITGRVQMLSPGLSCLTCTRALDSKRILREMMTDEQRAADPYIDGLHEPQPAVISLNSTVASLAVTMMLGAVTPVPAGPRHQHYDGIRGQVRVKEEKVREGCITCSSQGSLARGSSWELPVRRRQKRRDAA